MLIGFKLQNFRSFLHEQTFSFLTSSDRMHEATHLMRTGMKAVPRVSKAAIAFGPNASGKTNLLAAFATFRDLILHSTAFSDAQFGERYTPFRFGPSVKQPTTFELDVLLDGVRYRYFLSYDARRVQVERLLVYRTGKSQRWFDRHFDPATCSEEWTPFSPSFNGPREMWRKATRPQALFLTTAAQLNSGQLGPLVHWIEHCLEILLPADVADLARFASSLQEPEFKTRVMTLLRGADLNVTDVRIAEHDLAPADPVRPSVPAAHTRQGSGRMLLEFLYERSGWTPVWLDAAFEAAGTLRLIALLVPLLDAIDHGKLLLIDEFDTSLHPLVARFLVRRINDPNLSAHGAQLLLTSHNTTLMDLNFLRRDEIWLVQLDENRTSALAPLLRSSPRKHELIAKNYLMGRYGAVPHIRSDKPPIRAELCHTPADVPSIDLPIDQKREAAR